MKKRIGLLAALAMCVTVGGVYATWNYMSGELKTQWLNLSQAGITDAVILTGENLTAEGQVKFLLDNQVTPEDYTADTVDASGTVTVTYETAADNVNTVRIYCNNQVVHGTEAGGVYLKSNLVEDSLYVDVDLSEGTAASDLSKNLVVTEKSGGGYIVKWTVSAEQMAIGLTDTKLILKTHAEYTAFSMPDKVQIEFSLEPIYD